MAVNGGTSFVGPIEAVNAAGTFADKPTDCEKPPDGVTDMERVAVPPCGMVVADGLAVRE